MSVRCIKCGKTLTNPRSALNGMGPVCWKKYQQGSIKDEDSSVKTIHENYAKKILPKLKKHCLYCGAELTEEILGYESKFGIKLGLYKFHIFQECPNCHSHLGIEKLWEAEA